MNLINVPGAYCLAKEGELYLVYLPAGSSQAKLRIEPECITACAMVQSPHGRRVAGGKRGIPGGKWTYVPWSSAFRAGDGLDRGASVMVSW